jgi:hypothetical protein
LREVFTLTEDRRLRHQRIKELLFEVSRLSEERRSAFLGSVCAGDMELRAELESLLAYCGGLPADHELGEGAEDTPATRDAPPALLAGANRKRRTG